MSAITDARGAPSAERRKGAVRRAAAMLAVATALAIAGTAAISAFVLHADFLTGAAALVTRVAFAHGALAAAAAGSPLVAVLLVGYAYMQRGLRRRAASARTSAAAPATRLTASSPSSRAASSPARRPRGPRSR